MVMVRIEILALLSKAWIILVLVCICVVWLIELKGMTVSSHYCYMYNCHFRRFILRCHSSESFPHCIEESVNVLNFGREALCRCSQKPYEDDIKCPKKMCMSQCLWFSCQPPAVGTFCKSFKKSWAISPRTILLWSWNCCWKLYIYIYIYIFWSLTQLWDT